MFIPPSFEPNGPREPQWFPRPVTDSLESSLDLLERLEEDRTRRLRAIANVAARTPIGLGGVEDRAHGGSTSNLSPKASAPGSNNYSRYRYYPPPSEASASLHVSYRRSERLCPTTSPVTTRNRHYRRGATPRSTTTSGTAMNGTTRDGATTPIDGIGSASVNDRAYVDDSGDTTLFHQLSSSSPFMSPPLDPRAGGGSSARAAHRRSGGGRRFPRHPRRQSREERGTYVIDTAAMPTEEEEWVTPPAMSAMHQTPGHGQVEDVYSQRRVASQQRRRRNWDDLQM